MKNRTFQPVGRRGRKREILHARVILPVIGLAAASTMLLVNTATAQPAKAPAAAAEASEGFKNLQVLPKDISEEALHDTMRGFAGALGVRCLACHVGDETKPMQTWNWASDDKPEKATARVMMKMTQDLNSKWITQVKLKAGEERVQVACATCHHGKMQPRSLQDVLTGTMADKGVDGAVARYRELRDKYYGRDAFDFGEQPLNQMAERLANDKKMADALTLLNLNAEMNPKSGRVQMMIGETQLAAGAKDKAIEAYRKAVELDPKNERAKRKLDELQGAAK